MATAKNAATVDTVADATGRVTELNENLIDLAKESGRAYLDTYETAVKSVVDFERAAAAQSPIAWVSTIANTHAQFVEEMTNAYLKTVRDAIK